MKLLTDQSIVDYAARDPWDRSPDFFYQICNQARLAIRLREALENMVAWFADPGRGLYDAKPEVYLAGSKPIVAKARKLLQETA